MPPNTISSDGLLSPSTRFISEQDFQEHIKQGDAVFIFDGKVYKVNNFITKHPGGIAVMKSALGRDVTDEIKVMHPPKVYEKMISLYYIGDYLPNIAKPVSKTAKEGLTEQKENSAKEQEKMYTATWQGGLSVRAYEDTLNSIHNHHQGDLDHYTKIQEHLDNEKVRKAYRQLEMDLKARGLFKCNKWNYAKECSRYILLFSISLWFTLKGTETWHYMVGAVFMGMFWHQLVFTAHDAGHNEITGKVETDHLIGVLIANFIGGLSIGWWKDNHNVHHVVTNHLEHDPDVQHLPFLAISTRFFQNLYSTYYQKVLPFDSVARFFIQYQHYLYYLIVSFGRFNLHRLSFVYLLTAKDVRSRKLELVGICCFFVWFGTLVSTMPSWSIRIGYVLLSYMTTFPLHVQITLSHFGMSTEDRGPQEPFATKMLRTTMDVDCPEWLDWFHGGLQYQAVHHLFPRIPRHNLRKCVPYIKEFCDEVGLHYYCYNFSTGNGVVLGTLKSVADQVKFMNRVAKKNADIWTGEKNHSH
ncbi:Delta(8)-fatty-acid desaturase [Choanephora cucurbitarum]|uniref:Delta(8)-fatty-acid desaturase n=1 Tax=Choanephora cucurbitarum TaxID=101091 RepID=A0A1C7NSQ4_9FUNG|nr:Delta(8)-fatty-acid desaturase [Choanephora cucurbitarum]